MAADSFIVYFERVRDELRSGRNLLSAVEVGWDRAKRTIYASKAVNMLAAVILYILAVGSVRGFAFTLGLTVIIDVLIVFLFTHPMLQLLSRTKFFGEGHPMSGMDPRLLGVKPAAYRGALNLSIDDEDKSPEAKRREKARMRKAGMTPEDGSETPNAATTGSESDETSTTKKTKAAKSKSAKAAKTATAAGGMTIAERKAAARRAEDDDAADDSATDDGKEADK